MWSLRAGGAGVIRYGSLGEQMRGADPRANVLRSIEHTSAGGDVSAAREMRDAFLAAEADDAKPIGRIDFTRSAGPVAEAFLMSSVPVAVLCGPRGSAKTTYLGKKTIYEGQSIRPGPDRVRRYTCGVWREKYVNLWDATIPSWWKLLPSDLAGSSWVGSKPHPATQVIRFRDDFGPIEITVRFRAFGEQADPDDTLGLESTDVILNQIDTLPEMLFTWLGAVVGRDPPRELLYPGEGDDFVYGKVWGDMNSPTPISWLYRDFYEHLKPGYHLFRQPGGLEPDAENIEVVGRGYYNNLIRINQHRRWWITINVHNRPGFKRDTDTPYATIDGPLWDDDAMMARETIEPEAMLPIVVGLDGGLTPAALYTQVVGGQARILAEIALERGGMRELADRMLEVEAKRFRGCEFHDYCDPSMTAGEDTAEKSDRGRLSEYLGREVKPARTNDPDARWEAVREKMVVKGGKPLLLVDPSCLVWRRGANGAYRFLSIKNQGSADRGNVAKDFTTHVHDAGQAAALEWGGDAARKRRTDATAAIEKRRQEAREARRYDPFQRARAR